MVEDAQLEMEKRLARLEERTSPKPKSFVENLKEWAGVGTLIVALLYTFPLGVWDRFIITPEQSKRKKVEEVRSVLIQMMDKDAELARSYNAISSDQVRAFFSRAIAAAKTIIISRSDIDFEVDITNELSINELIALGYSVAQISKVKLAERIYDQALQKARKEKVPQLEADLYRMKAGLYSGYSGSGADLAKVREYFDQSVKIILENNPGPDSMLQASNSAFEWASMELAFGDWTCGQILGNWALTTVRALPPINPDSATYAAQYQLQLARFVKQKSQPVVGCPRDRASWTSS